MALEQREMEARQIYTEYVEKKLNKENAMLLAASMIILAGAEIGEVLQMKGMGMNQGMGMGQGMQQGNYSGGRSDDFYRGRSERSGQFTSNPGRGGQAGRNMGGNQSNYMGGQNQYYDNQGNPMGNQGGYNGMMNGEPWDGMNRPMNPNY